MSDKPIETRPLDEGEKILRQKFYESFAAQSDLLDRLSEKLLTLELAIPGVYAAAVKLARGENAAVTVNVAFYAAFACWLLALIFTLVALAPKYWKVNTKILIQDRQKYQEGLGLEDFFKKSAQFKLRLTTLSSILFFLGVFSAVFTIG